MADFTSAVASQMGVKERITHARELVLCGSLIHFLLRSHARIQEVGTRDMYYCRCWLVERIFLLPSALALFGFCASAAMVGCVCGALAAKCKTSGCTCKRRLHRSLKSCENNHFSWISRQIERLFHVNSHEISPQSARSIPFHTKSV